MPLQCELNFFREYEEKYKNRKEKVGKAYNDILKLIPQLKTFILTFLKFLIKKF